MIDLLSLRDEIDLIDKELISLLSKRMELSKQVARYKKENNLEIINLEREEEIRKKMQDYAKEIKLHPFFVNEIWRSIIQESRRIQQEIISDENIS